MFAQSKIVWGVICPTFCGSTASSTQYASDGRQPPQALDERAATYGSRICHHGEGPLVGPERDQGRAYAIWISSGCRSGTARRDWFAAEEEVLVEFCRRRTRPAVSGWTLRQTRKKSARGFASKQRRSAEYSRSEGLPPLR